MSGREGFAAIARVGSRRFVREGAAARPAVRWPSAVPWDLVAAPLLALLAVGLVRAEAAVPLRTALGLPLVLFLPGYALVGALFPSREGPDHVARIALGFALSLAVMPPVALVLDRSPWRLLPEPTAVSLALVTAVAALAGAVRRHRLPAAARYAIDLARPRVPPPRAWDGATRVTVAVAAVAVALLVAGGAPIVVSRLAGDPLTELSLANADGRPGFFQRQLEVGEPSEVRLGVVNHEGEPMSYRIEVDGAGTALDPLPPVALDDGERWDGPVRFAATQPGDAIPVVFELHRADQPPDAPPYRTVQLVVDVAPGA